MPTTGMAETPASAIKKYDSRQKGLKDVIPLCWIRYNHTIFNKAPVIIYPKFRASGI